MKSDSPNPIAGDPRLFHFHNKNKSRLPFAVAALGWGATDIRNPPPRSPVRARSPLHFNKPFPPITIYHITTQSKWTTDLSYLASSSFPHSITTPPKQNLLAAFVLIKTNKEATEKKTNRCFFHLLKWYSTRTNQTHL